MTVVRKIDEKIIYGYVNEKLTMIQLAEILETNLAYVQRVLRRFGVKSKPRGTRPTFVCSRGKYCTQCGHMLPLSSFWKDPTNSSGRRSICKECMKWIARERSKRRK